MAVSADLAQFLNREWEDNSSPPCRALTGASRISNREGDADALRQAFNVKTVADLGRNKSSAPPRP